MKKLPIDQSYLLDTLLKLLHTPSPSGHTDRIVHLMCEQLQHLGVDFELTRRELDSKPRHQLRAHMVVV